MKQGSGHSSRSAGKVEPKSRGITPGAAGQPGIAEVRVKPQQVYAGRGIVAPKMECKSHPRGSQGRH